MELEDNPQFPQHANPVIRTFKQIPLLTKLFWKERLGALTLTMFEIFFPAYPVLIFYILLSLDIFPYERLEFGPVETYPPIPLFDASIFASKVVPFESGEYWIAEETEGTGFPPGKSFTVSDINAKVWLVLGLYAQGGENAVLFHEQGD